MHWWQSLWGEFAIVTVFIATCAFVAWRIQCTSQEKTNTQEQRLNNRNFFIAIATALGAYLLAGIAMWQVHLGQQALELTQRPYVSLGGRDGTIARLSPQEDGSDLVTMVFFNGGRSPALNFLLNGRVNAPPWSVREEKHIERWETTSGSSHMVNEITGAGNIPAESTHLEYITITNDQLTWFKTQRLNLWIAGKL